MKDIVFDSKTIVIIFIVIFACLSFLGINIKEIIIQSIDKLTAPAYKGPITIPAGPPSFASPSGKKQYQEDDGVILHKENKLYLSDQEKLPISTNELTEIMGEQDISQQQKEIQNFKKITPSVSKLLEKRGTKNAIHLIPSNSFTLLEPIEKLG